MPSINAQMFSCGTTLKNGLQNRDLTAFENRAIVENEPSVMLDRDAMALKVNRLYPVMWYGSGTVKPGQLGGLAMNGVRDR